jgi:hypothetical protein
LPVAPTSSSRHAAVVTQGMAPASALAWRLISVIVSVGVPSACKLQNRRNMPIRNAASPTRLAIIAFCPASALAMSVYQKPISR